MNPVTADNYADATDASPVAAPPTTEVPAPVEAVACCGPDHRTRPMVTYLRAALPAWLPPASLLNVAADTGLHREGRFTFAVPEPIWHGAKEEAVLHRRRA